MAGKVEYAFFFVQSVPGEVSFLSHNACGSASLKCDFTRVSLSNAKIENIPYRALIRRIGPGGYHWAHYVEFSSSNAE